MTSRELAEKIVAARREAIKQICHHQMMILKYKDDPPTTGFMYMEPGVDPLARTPFWIIAGQHTEDGVIDHFLVPVWDRPDMEHSHWNMWVNDYPVCYPLPELQGYGEAILNFNQAEWRTTEEIAGWTLVAVVDRGVITKLRNQWVQFLFPPVQE